MKSGKSGRVLVVDDDNDVLYTARLVLRNIFEQVDTLNSPCRIPDLLKSTKYDVILLDMNFTRGSTTGREGLDWLDRILEIDPEIKVVTTTAYGEINLAVQAIKRGAVDFITKPWKRDQLVSSLSKAFSIESKVNNQNVIKSEGLRPDIIGRSTVMVQILETIKTVAPTDANILILGENGTGKELVAWALHKESKRSNRPFVHVDLGSIPDTLFESELFGHTRGAFTDAREEREGRFETASGGTLFLDEIGNLSMPLQAKILTAIQNREIIRIGSNHSVPVNVRLISATNMPLYEMADSFKFRQDLLYRINTVEIILPPLRERKADINPIANYYLEHFSKKYGKKGIKLNTETIQKLKDYNWPGNIRELAHTIERSVIFCKSGIINPEDFNFRIKTNYTLTEEPAIRVEDFEKQAISRAMSKHNGNLSKAAEEIGIARSTLYRKIARFGMEN